MTDHARFVTIATTLVTTPAAVGGTTPPLTHLAALAMLIAERDAGDRWHFSISTRAVGAGDPEQALLEWAISAMPDAAIVVGWQLADAVVAPLIDAAANADPDIAATFLRRLMRLVTAPSVDLAIVHGGAGAPPLGVIAAERGIDASAMSDAERESAWAFCNRRRLAADAEAQAIGAWSLWLAESNGAGEVAARAFAAWRTARP